MARVKAHQDSPRSQIQFNFGIIDHFRGDIFFNHLFLVRLDVLAKKFQIFRVNPRANIFVGHDHGARLRKNAVARDVVQMVVRVNYKFYRQLCQLLNFREQLPGGSFVLERVDYRDAVFANHESGVRTSGAFGFIDGRKDVVSERLYGEEQGIGGRGFLRTGCARHDKKAQG